MDEITTNLLENNKFLREKLASLVTENEALKADNKNLTLGNEGLTKCTFDLAEELGRTQKAFSNEALAKRNKQLSTDLYKAHAEQEQTRRILNARIRELEGKDTEQRAMNNDLQELLEEAHIEIQNLESRS